MPIIIYLLKSFSIGNTGGNGAGIVLNAEQLTDQQRQQIATETGLSETAFVEKSKVADFKVRFFTPKEEVPLCGHATIAVYSLLFQKGLLKAGSYTQEIPAGILGITISPDGFVEMEQTLPIFSEYISAEEITACLDIPLPFTDLKPQIVSTGLRDIFVHVENRKILDRLVINPVALAALNKRTATIGLHSFTLDTIDPSAIAYCRNFAPLYGIDEESATGSSNGALACYLFKNGKLTGKSVEKMKFEQGYALNQPSEIFVTLDTSGTTIQKVRVGGTATIIGQKELKMLE